MEGGNFPAARPDLEAPLNAADDNKPFYAPHGSDRGQMVPGEQPFKVRELTQQMQIWNPDFAFAYPYFETNAEGELGMAVAFGGAAFHASSGIGVLGGDFVIYYPRLSGATRDAYGHYHTARSAGSNQMKWVGASYVRLADGSILPFYLRFSR